MQSIDICLEARFSNKHLHVIDFQEYKPYSMAKMSHWEKSFEHLRYKWMLVYSESLSFLSSSVL